MFHPHGSDIVSFVGHFLCDTRAARHRLLLHVDLFALWCSARFSCDIVRFIFFPKQNGVFLQGARPNQTPFVHFRSSSARTTSSLSMTPRAFFHPCLLLPSFLHM
jgi:hypothetical protein